MENYRPKSPVSSALAKVLGCFHVVQPPIFSYEKDFDQLWRMEHFVKIIQSANAVVVRNQVDNRKMLGGIDVSQWISTADWIVTLSITAVKTFKDKKSIFKLFVLDLNSNATNISRKTKILTDLIQSNRSPLPWIRMAEPINILPVVSLLADTVEQPVVSNSFNVLPLLWAAELTSPLSELDRHSVTNIVSPRILAACMSADESSQRPINALDVLMRALGLIPATAEKLPASWVQRTTWISGRVVNRFVLIDDMADLGWAGFLRSALDLRPDELVSYTQLKVIRDAEGEHTIGQFDDFLAPDQIVFVDLRLFANLGWPSEASFLKLLARKARILSRRTTPSAWPTVTEEELSAVERAANANVRVEGPDYHTALTIFPRLLALEDPLLPIVLFSSTGRREILEKLLPYGNIITDFDKPRFFGQTAATTLLDCRQRFQRAIDKALKLARGRALRHAIARLDASRAPLKLAGDALNTVISIYIDESAEKHSQIPFSVGGLVLIAPSAERMQALDDQLHARGFVWGLAHNRPPTRPQDALPDDPVEKEPTDYSLYLARLDELFQELNIEIAAFALVQRTHISQRPKNLPEILDEGKIDNLYRSMLAEVLEAVLLDLTSEWGDAAQINVDVATRQGTVSDVNQMKYLKEQFGVVFPADQRQQRSPQKQGGEAGPKFRYYSLGHADVYPIVAKLLSHRPQSGYLKRVKAVRGVTLTDFAQLKELRDDPQRVKDYIRLVSRTVNPRPYQIHYLADWIARFARWNKIPTIAKKWFGAGFLQDRNSAFASWLRAGRAADQGEYLDAVSEIITSGATAEPFSDSSFARWTRHRLVEWQRNISGAELLALCDRISSIHMTDQTKSKSL